MEFKFLTFFNENINNYLIYCLEYIDAIDNNLEGLANVYK